MQAIPHDALLRRLAAALALPLALCFALAAAPGTAHAANACVAKGGIGGTGYTADGGVGGTGALPDGGVGGTGTSMEGGIGGTGNTPDGGVGGTGKISSGGIGGTGATASGIGVVGTVTGFASVCVNGLEVHYAASTPVIANGLPASVADLAMGQVVTIEASGAGYQAAGELSGVRISILNAVAGPIAAIDADAAKFSVLGQTVRVTPQTLIADATGIRDFSALAAGALVRVAGLRLAGGDVIASRIEIARGLDQASVLGPVTASDATGFSIYGLRVAYADVTGSANITSGEVMVSGRLDGSALRPERIALAPSLSFAQNVDHLVLEGYIGSRSDTAISVGGIQVQLSATTTVAGMDGSSAADLATDVRVQVTARLLPDHSIVADSILLRRDPLAPPSPASIMPPPRGKGLSFNRPGDSRLADAGAAGGTHLSASVGGAPGTVGGGLNTSGTSGTIGNSGTNGGTLGGGSNNGVLGGGLITPGGGGGTTGTTPVKTTPTIILPRPRIFDAMDFRPLGLPRVVAH